MTTTNDQKSVLTKDEAQAAVEPILEGMLKWYWDETDKWEWWAWRLQTGVLFMSFLVTVAAALPPLPPYQEWMKWGVVFLSAFTTLLSGLLSKSGLEHTAQLRERGRIKLATLKQKAMLRFMKKPMTEDERLTYLERLIDATEDIEEKFGVNPLSASRRGGTIADA
jgi:hypothetical protein